MIILLSTVMRYVIAAIVIVVFLGIFITGFLLNKKTAKPDGCPELQDCVGCGITSCRKHPSHENKEKGDVDKNVD